MDREEMIDKIVDHDTNDIREGYVRFLVEILIEGFKGYDNFTDEELKEEYEKILYNKYGSDNSVVDKIVDYAYKNFDAWFSQAPAYVDYFHNLHYEDKILEMDKCLDNLADYIYGAGDGLVRDLGMDRDEVYDLIALNPEVSKEIGKKIVDKFYKE